MFTLRPVTVGQLPQIHLCCFIEEFLHAGGYVVLALNTHCNISGSLSLPERQWISLGYVSGGGKALGVKRFNIGIDPVDLTLVIQASCR